MFRAMQDFHRRHGRWIPIVFFLLGFVFDALMLRRVDEWLTIIQQMVYLTISAILIRLEVLEVEAPKFLSRIWTYREALLHFLMGTLLNAYTIFYFKSASAVSSFVFIFLLVGLLIINEFGRFGKAQTQVHLALFSLCLISFLVTLSPILLGFMGIIPFLVANLAAFLIFWVYSRWLRSGFTDVKQFRWQVELPIAGILSLFAVMYFLNAIPPVPLSIQFMGIYHDIQKSEGNFVLSSTNRAGWFARNGDRRFLARPGDIVHCFVRIFSPARFKDQLQVRWLVNDPRLGWQTSDVIPLPIVGGREEGFRGTTKKSNYHAGDWRVQVETADGREIGRIGFTIEDDSETTERVLTTAIE